MPNNKLNIKKEEAKSWVHGYTAVGTGIVIAAIIPGSTSAALIALEATMAFHIGQIYNKSFTFDDATEVAKKIGFACVLGKIAVLEALNFVPLAGWIVKAPIAATIIEILGDSIIEHFEKKG
jgi:uncharacterized protein (DUF697 family)